MSEKRKKIASFCLKTKAGKPAKVELFDAEQWEDGPRGLVRLRVDGRWQDAPDGSRLYYNSAGVAALVQAMLSGTMPHAAPRPLLRVGQPVCLPCAPYDRSGFAWGSEMGRILSESAVMGIDGRWYVIVWGMKNKTCFMPFEDVGVYNESTLR